MTEKWPQTEVTEEQLKCIGDITVSFAKLELVTQLLAGSLIAEEQFIGRILTVELPFRTLRAVVISLYKERQKVEDEDYQTLQELMKRAAEIEDRRNQIIHSVWLGGDENTITRIKTKAKERHGLKFDVEDVTTKSLADDATKIKQLTHEVVNFLLALTDKGKVFETRSSGWQTTIRTD